MKIISIESFHYFIEAFWFILPIYIANMTPVFVKKINLLNIPVDLKKKFMNKRIFGDHKTWRGLVFGILAGGLTSLIQRRGIIIGLILGFGGLFGDLVGSFIKRRLDMEPGDRFPLIDKLDFILGSFLFVIIFGFFELDLGQAIVILLITFLGQYITDYLGFKLGLKDVPW